MVYYIGTLHTVLHETKYHHLCEIEAYCEWNVPHTWHVFTFWAYLQLDVNIQKQFFELLQ